VTVPISSTGKPATATGIAGRLFAWLAYPAALFGGLAFYALLLAAGWSPALAAYPAAAGGVAIILLQEALQTYRTGWRPNRQDLKSDALFLAVVQIAQPQLLLLLLAVSGLAALPVLEGIWPSAWPLWLQVAAMILLADFGRYWLHRAAHSWPPLWRLHAVHHAPCKLYALSVARFHPGEKLLQALFDSIPFALLGVPEAALAGYLVFYAVNGFAQHSNGTLRLGPLNWLVSGPELHRWHHAEDPRQAQCNFGNNLILWDLLFGTRFLPKERQVGAIGVAGAMPARGPKALTSLRTTNAR